MAEANLENWAAGAYGLLVFLKVQMIGAGGTSNEVVEQLQIYLDSAPAGVKDEGGKFLAEAMATLK
jgi:hypothetical protein